MDDNVLTMEPPKRPISDLLSEAFQIYKKNVQVFLTVGLIYGILSALLSQFLGALNAFTAGNLLFANMFIAAWASVTIIYAAARIYQRKPLTIQQALVSFSGRYLPYLAVYFALFGIVGLGFLMLFLPGLYLATIFIFADLIIVLERTAFVDAFRRSFQLVNRDFWRVFRYLFVIVLISVTPAVAGILFSAGHAQLGEAINRILAVVIMPYYVIAQVTLYVDTLRAEKFISEDETE